MRFFYPDKVILILNLLLIFITIKSKKRGYLLQHKYNLKQAHILFKLTEYNSLYAASIQWD